MKDFYTLCFVLLICSLFGSCNEIFSPDISFTNIEVLAPADSLYTSRNDLTFWWEEDSDVESVRLRIWEIDQSNRIPLSDSSLFGKKADITLDPNRLYEWEIRGENEGSESPWTQGWLLIDQEAPEKAAALSLNGDTLTSPGPDTLRWQSNDLAIPGVMQQFGVHDSVYISARDDSTRFVFQHYFELGTPKFWPIRNGNTPLLGPGRFYWKVISRDRAGNRNSSQVFHFDVL